MSVSDHFPEFKSGFQKSFSAQIVNRRRRIVVEVEHSLKRDGFKVNLTYCLEEARRQLKNQPFNLVRLELSPPDGDGSVGIIPHRASMTIIP